MRSLGRVSRTGAGKGVRAPTIRSFATDVPARQWCTGLYLNLSTKQVAPDVREFRPAATLWSNGADKVRWIYLPPDTTIDASDPREWVFPVGTKFWKELSVCVDEKPPLEEPG